MIEQYIFQILAGSLALLLTIVGFFCRRVLTKMDDLHDDLVTLTVNHSERITKLEAAAHWHRRSGDKTEGVYSL